jgi:hypothetical protein
MEFVIRILQQILDDKVKEGKMRVGGMWQALER